MRTSLSATDFDQPPDRSGGDSIKWNRYRDRDVIPLWVADMDFQAPEEVVDALRARVAHGVFGYGEATESLLDAVEYAMMRDHGWVVRRDWLVPLPGLVTGLNLACRLAGAPGDAVITAAPVYPPFLSAPRLNERELVRVPLLERDGRWSWDLPALEAAITPASRLLLLCHPHNPVGQVWNIDELRRLAAIAERHDLIVCSDEIHAGLILEPQLSHTPLAALGQEIARRTITLIAPSKTYNLPGLGCAFAVVADEALRTRLRRAMRGIVPDVNVLGLAACEAAYRHGESWRQALLPYLRGNRDRVCEALHGTGGLKVHRPQATYLAWIDCRETGIERPARFFEEAGVGLSDGADFGAPGFVRLNFGCGRHLLDAALERMTDALQRR